MSALLHLAPEFAPPSSLSEEFLTTIVSLEIPNNDDVHNRMVAD